MVRILKYTHTLLMIVAVGFLRYFILTGTSSVSHTTGVAAGITVMMLVLLRLKYSHVTGKKWWIIAVGVLGIIVSELAFQHTDFVYVNDIVKLWLVITIFMALFGVFSEKKKFVKGEYSKKTQIIEV